MEIVDLDFQNDEHVSALLDILATYSNESGAGKRGMASGVEAELPQKLDCFPGRVVLLALADDRPVGVAVCLTGFSTFNALPVLNVHDLAVLPEYRGKGVGVFCFEQSRRGPNRLDAAS